MEQNKFFEGHCDNPDIDFMEWWDTFDYGLICGDGCGDADGKADRQFDLPF